MPTPPTRSRRRRSSIEAGCGDALVELLDPDPLLRRYAVDAIELDAVGLYALRDRLLDDSHGPVRAAAAERLARAARAIFDGPAPTRAEAIRWVGSALRDPLSSVRVIACRAAARHAERDAELEALLAQMLTRDPLWRARRAAARALAAVAGEAAISMLIPGLEDPFWRVRHGVIQALEFIVTRASRAPSGRVRALGGWEPCKKAPSGRVRALGGWEPCKQAPSGDSYRQDPCERARLRREVLRAGEHLQEAARAALAYLASGWPEGEDEVPEVLGIIRDPGAGLELSDPDPAVVTARLQGSKELDPAKLVPLLAESHVPLREEAARRLATLGDPACLAPALAWLEDPRVPNAPAGVRRLLDRLGRRAQVLVEHALAHERPGALAWAATWIGTHPAQQLHPQLLAQAGHPHAEVRAAVIAALGRLLGREHQAAEQDPAQRATVEHALGDPSPVVRDAAALALCALGQPIDRGAHPFASFGPLVRARLLGLAPSLEERGALGLDDPDSRVRATALRTHPALSPEQRAAALAHPDPWVRAAALDVPAAISLLRDDQDRDPGVRRTAARVLVRAREHMEPTQLDEISARLHADLDPWLRARGSDLLDPSNCTAGQLGRLLLATRDPQAMVRSSASARLDRVPRLVDGLERLLTGPKGERPGDDLSIAAWSRLIAELAPDDARARLELGPGSEPGPRVRSHLRELAVLLGADPPATGPRAKVQAEDSSDWRSHATNQNPQREPSTRRALGHTGIELAPLVISGAFSPTPSALAFAAEHGVDTFFWEPRYANATRFLRQPRRRSLQVIAGSFHADRQGLTHDLEVARRRLRREQIDLFLLFWVRSPARLDPRALETLREFQARGWIRSYGFSTHDRAIACAAVEGGGWPVIMTRHNAAHVRAEDELLPGAAAAGVGVLGFSALCYGRMLRPSAVFPGGAPAPDCYRYSLSQPAVAACISAPQGRRQLVENLAVLHTPTISEQGQEVLRAHGKEIYADNKRFDRLLRRGGTAPLREAILDLFARASEPAEAASTEAETPTPA